MNFEKILNFATAKYVYGLTATPTRQEGQQAIKVEPQVLESFEREGFAVIEWGGVEVLS